MNSASDLIRILNAGLIQNLENYKMKKVLIIYGHPDKETIFGRKW